MAPHPPTGHDAHGHAGHDHSHAPVISHEGDRQRVLRALLVTVSFMAVEVAGALYTGSLALLADAGHMLTDSAALALSWLAFHMSTRPDDARLSYGYHRFQVLAAFINGLALVAMAVFIANEAIERLSTPRDVLATPMLAIALTGLVVNVVAFRILHGGNQDNLNMRGATLHVLADLLGSVAASIGAVAILLTGAMWVDPAISLMITVFLVYSAWQLLRRSALILLEGVPHGVDLEHIKANLTREVGAVDNIHHVHAWSLTSERPLLTLHARLHKGSDHPGTVAAIKAVLLRDHGIDHSTVQVEEEDCPDEGTHGPRPQG